MRAKLQVKSSQKVLLLHADAVLQSANLLVIILLHLMKQVKIEKEREKTYRVNG